MADSCGHPHHGADDHDCTPFTAEYAREPWRGRWRRVSRGWQKWGLWHYAPDRRNPTTGAWRGYGSEGLCGAELFRRTERDAQTTENQPDERLCRTCLRLLGQRISPGKAAPQ